MGNPLIQGPLYLIFIDFVFKRNSLASNWKNARNLAFCNLLSTKAPATKKADNTQATINTLYNLLLALHLVALIMEKSADVGMFLVAVNYLYKQLNMKSTTLDPNDVIKLCRVYTVMTTGAIFYIDPQSLAMDPN